MLLLLLSPALTPLSLLAAEVMLMVEQHSSSILRQVTAILSENINSVVPIPVGEGVDAVIVVVILELVQDRCAKKEN